MPRFDNDLEIDNSTAVTFYHQTPETVASPPDCVNGDPKCVKVFTMEGVGKGTNTDSGRREMAGSKRLHTNLFSTGVTGSFGPVYATSLTLSIPSYDVAGSYGFSVQLLNGISSVKFDPNTLETVTEEIQLLDPAPAGTGEWLTIAVPKWDFNWVRAGF